MERKKITWGAIICSNLTTLMLGICDNIGRGKPDFASEHMSSVGSLDIVNLLTISADTKMSSPMDDFTNQNQR